jgi:hypothetical protein
MRKQRGKEIKELLSALARHRIKLERLQILRRLLIGFEEQLIQDFLLFN